MENQIICFSFNFILAIDLPGNTKGIFVIYTYELDNELVTLKGKIYFHKIQDNFLRFSKNHIFKYQMEIIKSEMDKRNFFLI